MMASAGSPGAYSRFLQGLYKAVTVKNETDISKKPAVVWKDNNKVLRTASYRELYFDAQLVAHKLLSIKENLRKKDIGYYANDDYVSNGRVVGLDEGKYTYVRSLLSCLFSESAFVPLAINHPPAEWKYFIENSEPYAALYSPSFSSLISPLVFGKKNLTPMEYTNELPLIPHRKLDPFLFHRPDNNHALMIYTSGTTGRPKGVVLTLRALDYQLEALKKAWEWSKDDQILNCLPLHHINGIVNVVLSSLNAGATLHMMGKFNVKEVWDYLIENQNLTIFMAVPTIYAKMLDYYEDASDEHKLQMQEACRRLRLMVSGSAALPISLLKKWEEMSSHRLLERYGMSELGMVLSNSLHGERFPGKVGKELPYVTVRLVDGEEKEVKEANEAGELRVKSFLAFSDYWKREGEYAKSFDKERWFKTGDTAMRGEDGVYQILGRSSVDILKVGGYKISALDIEFALLSHPLISSCVVIGKEDEKYGQEICAVVVKKKGAELTGEEISKWAKDVLAPYKIPRSYVFLDEIPTNAMGKVNKKALAVSLFPTASEK